MLSFLDAQKIFKNSTTNINIETIESVYESFLMNENTDSFASLQNQFIHREQLMQLLHWYSTQIEQKTLHPVLIAGIFYFNFHLINPFKKFNERMARLFTSEILKENGYSFLNILPVEKFYTENLEAYKQFFVASSEQYRQMPEWLYFFADGLADTAQQALINHSFSAFNESHIAPENLDEAKPLLVEKNGQADRASVKYINKRQTNIKVFIREKQPVKISDIAAHFEKISYNTIKKDLQLLVQYDFAQPVGNKKGTVYISKN